MEALALIGVLLRVLLALALLAFALYCGYIQWVHVKYDHIPSAPRARAQEYGPVLRFNAFHRVSLLIVSPEGVKEYLMLPQYPKDRFVYGRLYNMFGVRFLGNGLVTDREYDHWHKQRRIMDPAFSRTYLIGLMETFNNQAEELMMELEKKADGETKVDVMDLLRRVTLDVIAKVAFGLELNTLHDEQTPFPHAVNLVMKGMTNARIPLFRYMPGNRKTVREIQESLRLLRRTGKACIEQRQKAIKNEEEVPMDILTQILKNAAQEEHHDIENMLDNFVTFFVAGHETTANQLSFAVMELSRHPDIVVKLQAEVDEFIGVKRDIAYEDLGKLEYLSQVLKEVLRLYPPVPGTVRWTGKENVIEGVRIPPNTTLIFSTYIMGRMEKYFKDALTFNPDRFNKDQLKPYFSYFPFSLGPRSCIGQIFSQMEAKVVMAKFLQRFDFQLVPPQSFKAIDTGTLRPLDGVLCRLKPRHQLSRKED
nr:PREDICTED: cholesterol 24-hydroxylase isoform X2 [Anolis carolinensis]|eukprot:XP_016851458.1 PREDICTED: cholesterol 24-hydroxylase isoform X2 [Anolis carolinensis]